MSISALDAWNILYIEDDEEDYILTREMLSQSKRRKFIIDWAPSFAEGEEKLAKDGYDAVLIDYDLGPDTGIELIRAYSPTNPAPLILYTGRGSFDVDIEAMQAGATLYITKGEANPLLLERAIRYAVELKQKENDLREARENLERELAERKQAEEALEVRQKQLSEAYEELEVINEELTVTNEDLRQQSLLINLSFEPIFVRDPNGVILSWNHGCEQLYGYRREEATGKIAHALLKTRANVPIAQVWARLREEGSWTGELYHQTKDGREVIVESTQQYLEINRQTVILEANRDITNRKQSEQALHESEQLFNSAFEASPNAIVISRLEDGFIQSVNSSFEQLFGYPRQEAIGRTSLELNMFAHPEDRQVAVQRLREDGIIRGFEVEILNRSGEVRCAMLFAATIDVRGKKSMMTIIEDISDRKQAEEALRRVDARWEAAIETINVGAIIATEDEQVIYWNPAAREMHGFITPDEGIEPLEETPVTFQLWTPDGSHLLNLDEWPMRRIKRGETVRNLELRIRRPDQGWEKVFSYSGAMVDTAGGERLIFLTCQDLTVQRRVEAALRESEQRQRVALDAARMVAWEYDPATLKVTLSENAEEVLELPRRHENSDQGYGLIHPEDVEKHRALVTHAIDTGGSYVSVYRHPHPDKEIWLEEHGRAEVDAAGRTVRLVGVVQNITDRKQAEDALRISEEKFALSFRSSPIGLCISTVKDGRFIEVNECYLKLFGYSREELIGHTSVEMGMFSDPQERKEIVRRFREEGGFQDYPLRMIAKDGQAKDVLFSTERIELDGQECMLFLVQDVTERKQAEQRLHQSEEKYVKSFRSSPAAIAISTLAEGRFTEVNDRFTQMFGYSREEMLGRTSVELGLYQNPEERKELIRLAREEGGFRDYEIRLLHRSGEPRDLLFSGERVEIEGQEYLLALINDITERKKTEEALRSSEERLKEFIENTHDNFIALDREWRFTYANRHYGEVMGVDPQTLVGKNYWELFPQYRGKDLEENYRKVMEQRVPLHYRQGGVYTRNAYDVSIYPTREGIAIFSIERTEEFRKQREVEAERSRLETMLQALPVGIWIADPQGRLIQKNEEADRIWAGDAPLLESMEKYHEYTAWFADSGQQLEPEEYPVARALLTGQPVAPVELKIQRFDGSFGFVLVSAAPMKDREGNLLGVVGVNLDITTQTQAEERARASEERFRALANNIAQMTWIMNSAGERTWFNQRWFDYTGEKPEDVQGWGWLKVVHPDFVEPITDLIKHCLSAGKPWEVMLQIRGKDGQYRWFLSQAVPIFDEDGKVTQWFGTSTDLTEQRELQQELERSNQALRDFVYIASHDLQEPLHKVQAFGGILASRFSQALGSEGQEYLARMTWAAGRMTDMIRDLLAYSRVTSQPETFAEVDLKAVIHEVLTDLEARLLQTKGKVELCDLPTLQADRFQMHQLFQNLIGNALKYHRPEVPPEVSLRCRKLDDRVEIIVQDNGIGFDPQYAERIFNPFTRLHGRSSSFEGTGMGLAICMKIVERHGGKIRAASKPGQGSTFIITLPVKQKSF